MSFNRYFKTTLVNHLAILDFILDDLAVKRFEIRKVLKLKENQSTKCKLTKEQKKQIIVGMEQYLINITFTGKVININDYKKGE